MATVNAAIDFSAILGKTVGTAPEPKPIPGGTYAGQIEGIPQMRAAQTKEGPKALASITVALIEPMDDVDAAELAEAGGLIKPSGDRKTMTKDFFLSEESLWVLDQFLASFGFNKDSGKSYAEAFEELPGKDVICAVTQVQRVPKGATEPRTFNELNRVYGNA